MTEQDKARETARLLLEWADRKMLQMFLGAGKWDDYTDKESPTIHDPLFWRIKPEPRRMWMTPDSIGIGRTTCENDAAEWKRLGYTVTEWQEVLP